jgi:hypothetical protein
LKIDTLQNLKKAKFRVYLNFEKKRIKINGKKSYGGFKVLKIYKVDLSCKKPLCN